MQTPNPLLEESEEDLFALLCIEYFDIMDLTKCVFKASFDSVLQAVHRIIK